LKAAIIKKEKGWDSFHCQIQQDDICLQCLDISDVSAKDSIEFPKKKKWNDSKL